jgi:hypothetical protein
LRYFTLDAYNAWYDEFDDGPLNAARARYTRHLQNLAGTLPTSVLELARLRDVDDALVARVDHDRIQGILTLVLRSCGTWMGCWDLVLKYEGAAISPADERTLAQIARTTRTNRRFESDLFDHEVDAVEEEIEHRLVFHPWVWFAIRCRALRWEQIPRPNRHLPRLRDRFPGGPAVSTSRGDGPTPAGS